ncbi:MAG: UDP-glucose 4-epimerase [Microgenomates group bacterium GW2011_GWC1_41_8]|uniref:UDP-glucose 4-epimerase n=2 Tax=Candidatus Roizmaniibacteriota TaxID=1752723 RepID=A0A0G0T3F5_9BACT|nr:MAG: UDP-glucose 4-epimerase [Candidatus Roizmanbacteria bacterium GW2011_GWB1_40_7]KKR94230.1 MAG: UDP-glucose 4-epimerase [Candidatus Roizmanbacteria bacterium GW2011_GWA1_41_13]KKS24762.1 MAG: UDP-glucose 4-epimerase [Microgenomates group bacterium GW2011_GWC1_41_8]
MKILVTGGAGYIGSIMTRQLLDAGYGAIVYDNLTNGYQDTVDKRATFVKGDLLDKELVASTLRSHTIQAVLHFGGLISVGESMRDPGKYFTNNVSGTVNLLEAMVNQNAKFIIFSSTAGVYGNPQSIPIKENHPANPTSVYGESKLMIEKILSWYDQIHEIKSVSLRYFNAAGASLDGVLGERHKEETHIIPLAIQSVLSKSSFSLYGTDYDTPDGTCIRDYIHVEDLCHAHLMVLEQSLSHKISAVYNIGTGRGYSNKEILDTVEQISGKKLTVRTESRRPGDPSQLIADPSKITNELGWTPKHSDLPTIIQSAWDFHRKPGISS